MITYKVIRRLEQDIYISCMVSNKALVTYRIGIQTSAPQWLQEGGYHLTSFDDIRCVLDFYYARIEKNLDVKILKCEALEQISPLPPRLSYAKVSEGDISLVESWNTTWPISTVMHRFVTPLEVISPLSLINHFGDDL